MKNIIVFCIFSLLISCKKENDPINNTPPVIAPPVQAKVFDTIKPLPYFPAYPGSYWKYSVTYSIEIKYAVPAAWNTQTTIVTDTTSAKYQKDSYTIISSPPAADFHSDTFLVPFYNNVPIWGSKKHIFNNPRKPPLVYVVNDSLEVGTSWFEFNEFYGYKRLSILTKDTSITLNGQIYSPVIIVRNETSYIGGADGPYSFIDDFYYAKNIGLIKSKTVYTSNADLYRLNEKLLIEYYINK